jgi:hypothetical protein
VNLREARIFATAGQALQILQLERERGPAGVSATIPQGPGGYRGGSNLIGG